MASMQNSASLNVHPNSLSEKNDDFESIFNSRRRVCFDCDHVSNVRKPLRLNANTRTNVETINGKKVNGSHVGGISYLEQTNSECDDDQEPKNHEYLMGRFVENRFVFRQSFVIRSYEIGPDKTATMETLMNLLQETALNHVASSGVGGNGFGATREMSIRKLIWVVTRILVQVDKYSSWGDLVEIDTWVDAAGKNGMRRDWVIRDFNTKKIITRATSTWAMMNRETRRLSKIPDEVKNEVQPFYLNRASIPPQNNDSEKIKKLTHETAHIIRTGLAPRWSDMDANQHVNNVKYIGWILESVPIKILEDYNLTSMILEYRRECRQSNVLESLTSMKPRTCEGNGEIANQNCDLECTHLLHMEDDHAEIIRARSVWHLKNP
ncbi:palmitoyl-acyl carrier protein thioesterase, chloroplastic-like [Primulina huaijiensis]|uniref:palmitoyl-acyl carrier protein thioesterase, chloroplastic-like n=1 Tax=Primulina huaijiensis TaxID=1492673 RepID=UPI003CC6F579